MEMISGLAKVLGYDNIDKRLLRQALTHKSFTAELGNSVFKNNERLEFLGDSILGFIIADFLFNKYPNEQEGNLSKMKSVIVSEPSLAEGARLLNLQDYLILAECEDKTGGRDKDSILSDAFEAVIAVIYLNVGIDSAREFIFKYLDTNINNCQSLAVKKDTKGLLQELTQERYKEIPTYTLISESGPDHDKTFVYEVSINQTVIGRGEGKNKKSAQQNASLFALENYFGVKDI